MYNFLNELLNCEDAPINHPVVMLTNNRSQRTRHKRVSTKVVNRIKMNLRQYFGCSNCGSMENLSFHHIDPTKKSGCVSSIRGYQKVWNEISKCCVLCTTCHDSYHNDGKQVNASRIVLHPFQQRMFKEEAIFQLINEGVLEYD